MWVRVYLHAPATLPMIFTAQDYVCNTVSVDVMVNIKILALTKKNLSLNRESVAVPTNFQACSPGI